MKAFTRENIPVNQLSNGQSLELKKFDFVGENEGIHVHIQSSVHGAEVQGNAVIWELMNFLSKVQLTGSITIIPLANPLGSNTKTGTYTQGRFNPVTGDNWNRNYIDIVNRHCGLTQFSLEAFWDSVREEEYAVQVNSFKEYLFAAYSKIEDGLSSYGLSDNVEMNLKLQKFASTADIVLDLHTGPAATRYLYAGEYALKRMQDFPFPHNLIIPNEFGGAMDEACFYPWVGLTAHVQNIGESFINPFESYTVELGSEEVIHFDQAKKDALRILLLLSARGMIKHSDVIHHFEHEYHQVKEEKRYACLLKDYTTYYAPKGGLIEYLKRPGDVVKKGEDLYRILDFTPLHSLNDLKDCIKEVKAHKQAIVINHTPSASITKGTITYQVMEEFYELQ